MSEEAAALEVRADQANDTAATLPAAQQQGAGFGEHIVVQSNELVEACYKLTLHEQRLLMCCIAQLDSRKPSFDQPALAAGIKAKFFKVAIADYVATFPDCASSKSLPADLAQAADELYERDVVIRPKEGGNYRVRWLGARGIKENGAILLNFSEAVMPHLTELSGSFTKYYVKSARGLRLPYAIRLYQFLIKNRMRGMWRIELDEFIARLELSYDRFTDVRRRVVIPAVDEINSETNLSVSWEPVKEGRAVKYLEFRFGLAPKPSQGELF